MKRILLLSTLAAFMFSLTAQQPVVSNDFSLSQEPETKVSSGNSGLKIVNNGDELKIRLGDRGLTLTENQDFPFVTIDRYNDDIFFQDDEDDKHKSRKRSRRRFTPHWASVEFGINNYVTSDYSITLPPEDNFMDLNTGKSFNFNINFAQLGIGLSRHFGLVTGVGFEFNCYIFDGNNNIMKDENGVIVEYDASLDGITLEKSKFSTTYFVVPLLLEAQIPVSHGNTINLAAGVIGGAKLCSKTKRVYYDGGKEKYKEKDDYSLNILRYGPTVRLGYEHFQLYATYYMNGLFQKDMGPELYPFQIGVSFAFD
jgi:hypothetical protein